MPFLFMDKNDIYNLMDLIKKEVHRLGYDNPSLYSEWIKYYWDLYNKLDVIYNSEKSEQVSLFSWGKNYED